METEKKVNRGLHGISIGSIIAALTILLANPEKAESILWYVNRQPEVERNITAVAQLQSLVFDMRIRMDRMESDTDSLVEIIQSLQRATHVLAEGKEPYDSVSVVLSSGQRKQFHSSTSWIWRER